MPGDTQTSTGQAVAAVRQSTPVAGAKVTLISDSVLRRADGSYEYDKGEFAFGLGDSVSVGKNDAGLIIDLGDGASITLSTATKVIATPAGTAMDDFDVQIDVGSARYDRPPAAAGSTAVTRPKLLRSPAVVVAAVGTTYVWSMDTAANCVVQLTSGVYITLRCGSLWELRLSSGQQTSFRDGQIEQPTYSDV